MDQDMARMNVTYSGQNGDLNEQVAYDTPDNLLLQMAKEAIQGGSIPGIVADADADLDGFVVQRFPATGVLPNRVVLRPKTPFGGR